MEVSNVGGASTIRGMVASIHQVLSILLYFDDTS